MKRKLVWLVLFLTAGVGVQAQSVLSANKLTISFFSSAPIEDIQAETTQGSATIDTATGAVYFKIPVHSFQFESNLMQSHFNAEYLETKEFPNALFKGRIKESVTYSSDGTYPIHVVGDLTIHGVTRKYSGSATLVVKAGQLHAHTDFKVRLEDYNIEIPSMLTMNIAEVVAIKVDADYSL